MQTIGKVRLGIKCIKEADIQPTVFLGDIAKYFPVLLDVLINEASTATTRQIFINARGANQNNLT